MYCPELIDIWCRDLTMPEILLSLEYMKPAAREVALQAVARIRAGGTTFNETDAVRVVLDEAFDTHRMQIYSRRTA